MSLLFSADDYVENLGPSAIIIQNTKTLGYFKTWTTVNPLYYIRNANLITPLTGTNLKGNGPALKQDDNKVQHGSRLSTVKKTLIKHQNSEWKLIACLS